MYKFTIRGARGGIPACDSEYLKYGGHTTCFTLETEHGILIIDAGSGLASLTDELNGRDDLPPIVILFTHFHMDHVLGLPFFDPLYKKGSSITLMGDPKREDSWKGILHTFIATPYWPVPLRDSPADLTLEDLPMHRNGLELFGARVNWCPVWHPQQCLAYKIEIPGLSVVVGTDREPGNAEMDGLFLDFIQGCDFLVYDAEYTPEELDTHRGWGHGTWQDAVQNARAADVGQLILSHHNRRRTDPEIDALLAAAQDALPGVRAASQNMVLVDRSENEA